jgi:hypothetical protein
MGTVFECPCPECGQRMDIRCDGDVECAACDARYRARMGYLLPLPRRGTTETPAATGGTTTVKRP